PDASGYYPKGTTWVKFIANDGCGGYSECKVKVTVKDMKKPTPYCEAFVATSLGLMHDGYYVDLWPKNFDAGSFDNCTPQHQLQLSISPTRVTCDDVGQIPVRLTVTDAHGNSDYCTAILDVQDNMGMCPPRGMISGRVVSSNDEQMQDVQVALTNNNMNYMTNHIGQFAFPDLLMDQTYEFRASKNDDPLNGITSFDLVVLLRHLFGADRITNPYRLIAADVDKNGRVSASDLMALRRLVLNQVSSFEEINPEQRSWVFIDKDFEFEEGASPFEYRDFIRVNGFEEDMYDADFIGVKIGDINQSITLGRVVPPSNGIVYEIDDQHVTAGEVVEVAFNANMNDFVSQQFTLDFDTDALEFVGFENG
ncbi:MAG: dockerin type I domain-containing protein, partial [Bacteroidota bacterium]